MKAIIVLVLIFLLLSRKPSLPAVMAEQKAESQRLDRLVSHGEKLLEELTVEKLLAESEEQDKLLRFKHEQWRHRHD